MMRTLAIEWSRFNIKLCALAAGQFGTETLRTKYPQVVVENVERSVPLGRVGEPEEMAWLVAYLASPAGDFFSGTTITIDGARDDWAGPWPPAAITGESGEPVAEERRADG
jgi:citronellol/citronellal dehydrogenase